MTENQQHGQTDKGQSGHDPAGSGDCTGAVARLYEYLDGELAEGDMDSVATHLRNCSPCLEAFDFHAELRRMVASKCSEQMPDDVRSRLLRLIDAPRPEGEPS